VGFESKRDLGREAADLWEKYSVKDSLDKQAERMELEDYAAHLRRAEGNHCSLEALVPPIDHRQTPYE
jgi:hypothetical protein